MREKIIFKSVEPIAGPDIVPVKMQLLQVQSLVENLPDADPNKAEILEDLRLATEELTVYLSL